MEWCLHRIVDTIDGLVPTRLVTGTKGKVYRLNPFDIRPVPDDPITAEMLKASLDHECNDSTPFPSEEVSHQLLQTHPG